MGALGIVIAVAAGRRHRRGKRADRAKSAVARGRRINTIDNPMAVPGFWDPRRRPERPDLSRISIIRFLTETDYPPFNFAGPTARPPASMSTWRG